MTATAPVMSPPDRETLMRDAFSALRAGQVDAVIATTRDLAHRDDLDAMTLHGLGLALDGQAEAAAHWLVEVAPRRPETLHPVHDLTGLLMERNQLPRGQAVYDACLARTPDDPRLWLAYGDYFQQSYRFAEAERAARQALSLHPRNPIGLNQLGIALTSRGAMEEGLAVFREATSLWPDSYAGWSNTACTLAALGRFEAALADYRRAVSLRPDDAQLRLNHAICLLKAGRMTQGWAEYEWRLRLPGHTDLPHGLLMPSLGPDTRLDGKTVLVTQEEGLGDTLQFLRFIPALAARGAHVVAWVPGTLAALASRVEGIGQVLVGDVPSIEFHWHCPFLSLPRAFAGTGLALGAPVPYLRADPQQAAQWATHLPPDLPMKGRGGARAQRGRRMLKVGLVWGGAPRPHLPWANAIDRKRSMTLADLAPFASLRDIQFVSLQLGPPADQLFDPPDGLRIYDPMDQVESMDDTASLIAGLDAVVSVDTSVAHLAGAMGKPVLLLDRFDNCWRWLHGREDSPWYPSMRIVRQSRPEDWTDVVRRATAMLREMTR